MHAIELQVLASDHIQSKARDPHLAENPDA